MKKPNSSYLFFLVPVLVLFVISCSKDKSNESSSNTTTYVGTYKLTGLTVTVAPFPAQSILDSLQPCELDNLYKLNADSSFNYIDTGIVCNPSESYNSTWSVYSTDSIRIDTLYGLIQKFDGTTLVISSPVSYAGYSGTSTETFTKQ